MSDPTASLRKDGPAGRSTRDRPPFRRVLIANRGEIAVRIIRACRELGIETVAVYSSPDVRAAHVRRADTAVWIGEAPPSDSYLLGDAIVEAALTTGAEAIHPGYGFLSERAGFARSVEDAGLIFIGPSSRVISTLGDKLEARRVARSVGVACVPGTDAPVATARPDALEAIVTAAEAIGFPLLVKAVAGGGGRGMRRVGSSNDLPAALAAATAEAGSAFGDGTVYLERELLPARHIEVQLLGDVSGQVIAVGERDCSLQRRHQKLVEEAPAPGLANRERSDLHEMAVRIGRAVGLTNAATCEFLRTDQGSYFLEVNTRLQVEHGVTELVTGLDLVHEQLNLAAGRSLSPSALRAAERAASPDGHAIEVRLSAEDPANGFAPSPGQIRHWTMPAGPGVRVDTAVEAGERVAPEYDNLLAKVMVHGANRPAAIARLRRALDEVEIAGIQTTLPFHRFVARDASFAAGHMSTGWVSEHWDGPSEFERAERRARVAAGLHVLGGGSTRSAAGDGSTASASADLDGWVGAGLSDGVQRWPVA